MEKRAKRPIQLSPEYRDGMPLYRCKVCGNLEPDHYLDDDGLCDYCQPGERFEEMILSTLTEDDL